MRHRAVSKSDWTKNVDGQTFWSLIGNDLRQFIGDTDVDNALFLWSLHFISTKFSQRDRHKVKLCPIVKDTLIILVVKTQE